MSSPGHPPETAPTSGPGSSVGSTPSLGVIAASCPSRMLLEELSDKWTLLVIGVLDDQPMRFNALRRAVEGVSQKMLTQTLRRLERRGLVRRTVATSGPLAVEYSLTDLGRSLREPVAALWRWTEEHVDELDELDGLSS